MTMTRKEQFAAAALQGLIAGDPDADPTRPHTSGGMWIVRTAWALAEAMESEAIKQGFKVQTK
jgi:hypothetical protein